MTTPGNVRFFPSVIVAGAVAGALLLSVLHLANAATIDSRLIDADAEGNLPTWYTSSCFLVAALACVAAALAGRTRPARLGWLLLAALAAALSLDEVAALHEEAGTRLGEKPTLGLTQPLAALAVVALLLTVSRRVPTPAARGLHLTAGILAVSQVCASAAGLTGVDGAVGFGIEAFEDLTETVTAIALAAAALRGAGAAVSWRPADLRGEWATWRRGPAARLRTTVVDVDAVTGRAAVRSGGARTGEAVSPGRVGPG